MLEISTLGWIVTIAVIIGLLALDLILAAAKPHAVGFKEAIAWSIFYIAVAIAFGFVFWYFAGSDFGTQYFAGYIVEKSLSVDNLFVFVIIMTTFAVPEEHQHKVLTFGIIIALILRAIFIVLGAALLELFAVMFLLFGILLIYTAIQLYRHRDQDPDIQDNAFVKLTRKAIPVTDEYDGGNLFTRIDGKRFATPLFIVLIAIGSTDILFALDSIPAVFGVTAEPYIVFVANAFALLGLRALFFLVKGLLDRLVYLSTGLAIILGVHRGEADPALGARHLARDAGDQHQPLADRDRGGARRHDGGQPDQEQAGPGHQGARRIAPQPPGRGPCGRTMTPRRSTSSALIIVTILGPVRQESTTSSARSSARSRVVPRGAQRAEPAHPVSGGTLMPAAPRHHYRRRHEHS